MPRYLPTTGDRVRNERTGATGVVRYLTPWSVWVEETESEKVKPWMYEEITTADPGGTAV